MDKNRLDHGHRVIGADIREIIGPFRAVGRILRELYLFRSHIATIFSTEFANVSRGTVLGIFWNFALPLVPVGVYIMLVNLKVFPRFEGLEPAVYISFNVTLWMLFAGMITRPIQVVKTRTSEALKTSIPLSATIGSSFAELVFDTIIRIALVGILIVFYGPAPNIFGMSILLPLILGAILFLSMGLILSVFNMIYPDVDRVTGIILQYGIFVSGIIFPISTLGPLAVLENYNPFNVFVTHSREWLFYGIQPDILPLIVWSGAGILLAMIAFRFFYVMEHRIREMI